MLPEGLSRGRSKALALQAKKNVGEAAEQEGVSLAAGLEG